jgi:hypothetical protein
MDWLREQGVDLSTLRPQRYRLGGFGQYSAEGRFGFRVEWDPTHGAHVNVFTRRATGPHMLFPGNEAAVRALERQMGIPFTPQAR